MFTVIEAAQMLDNEVLTLKEIELLLKARQGVPLSEVEDDKEYKNLKAMNLVLHIPLSHPRVSISIKAVALTEQGVTVANEIDKRYRANSEKDTVKPYDMATVESMKDTKTARKPVENETPEVATTKEAKKKVTKE